MAKPKRKIHSAINSLRTSIEKLGCEVKSCNSTQARAMANVELQNANLKIENLQWELLDTSKQLKAALLRIDELTVNTGNYNG